MACLKGEILEQKALIEKLKEEAERKARNHEVDIQNMDRMIA